MFAAFFIIFSFQTSFISSLSSSYTFYPLEKTCGKFGSKQSLHLNSQAAIFTLNSEISYTKLDCHLELHVHSKALGFLVYIEALKIEVSPKCSRDYLQFGRDRGFITTHLSKRYCEYIEHSDNVTDIDGIVTAYNFGNTPYQRREYIEINDLEMDIWLELEPSNNQKKEVKLIVVPFRKSCGSNEEYYRVCPGTKNCFRRQFFCDNLVKCDLLSEEERNKYCYVDGESGEYYYLPFAIIGILVVIVTSALVGFGVKLLYYHVRTSKRSPDRTASRNSINPRVTERNNSRQAVASLLTPERDQRRPTSQEIPIELHPLELPAHPPSYDEVVGVGYKDDPPKYSDITQVRD